MIEKQQGLILKGIGGFYYVEAADMVYECKARGIFRKKSLTPVAGDRVVINAPDEGYAFIEEILPRKNQLVRPPVANIDQLVIIASTCEPAPSTLIIDKMIALAVDKGIEPILVLSKCDLDDGRWLEEIYRKAGMRTVIFSSVTGEGVQKIKQLLCNEPPRGKPRGIFDTALRGGVRDMQPPQAAGDCTPVHNKISALTGNSGVGKSSLLNCIEKNLQLATGDISQKLGRGRHTTRQVELISLKEGGYVADTPGFSSVDIERYEMVRKENLQFCFREFKPYLEQCRFTSCAHVCEKGCAVIDAVHRGEISKSRHDSYVAMYNEVKDIKEWEIK